MHLKNVNIILTFCAVALRVYSSPIKTVTLDLENIEKVNVPIQEKPHVNLGPFTGFDIGIEDIQPRHLKARRNEESDSEDTIVSGSDSEEAVEVSADEEATVVEDSEYSDNDDTNATEVADNDDTKTTEVAEETTAAQGTEEADEEDYIPRWDLTVDEINALVQKINAEKQKIIEEIEKVPDDECSFESVILPIAQKVQNKYNPVEGNLDLLNKVAVDKAVRSAAYQSAVAIEEFNNEYISGNQKLQAKFAKVAENISKGIFKAPEDPEDIRLYESFKNKNKDNSDLSAEDIATINKLQIESLNLANEIMDCLAEDESSIIIKKSDLEGLPESFLNNLEKTTKDDEEAYVIDMGSSYSAVKNYAVNPETRKAVMKTFTQRCEPNVERLKTYVNNQITIAHMRGYKRHSDYILQFKMAKNTTTVYNFMDSLKEKLTPITKEENDRLLAYKKKEMEKLGKPFDNVLRNYDVDYYKRILTAEEYSIDNKAISEYFPVDETTREMLNIYETIFSLIFKKVENPKVWHEDVRQFEVYDKKSEKLLGTFYLDMYSRSGKIAYTASPRIAYGYEKEDGSRYPASACLVSNFSKPGENEPSLLTHYEVTVLFHELGHIFHEILSTTKYSVFNGYNVEFDFIEAPSQMLEYWCYEPEIIEKLSHHYKDNSKRIPKDLIDAIIKSKNISSGQYNSGLLFKSYVDMDLYANEKVDPELDVNAVYDKYRKEITLVENIEGTWGIAAFDHIVDGYDAGYYGYLWSQVYAADMYYSQFKKHGILNPEVGERYRNIVLKAGATKDGLDILNEFLGREPNDEAFIKSISK